MSIVSSCRQTAVAALVVLAGQAAAQVQEFANWNVGNGNWSVPINWDTGIGSVVPNNGAGFTWAVTIYNGGLCNLDMSATIDKIGMTSGSVLNQFNGTQFNIRGDTDGSGFTGTFSLLGATFQMSSVGNNTDLRVTGGAGYQLTIGGTADQPGLIEMSNISNSSNRMYGVSGSETLGFSEYITVRGSGQIGANSATVLLGETGHFRGIYAAPLIVDPGAGGCGNAGFMYADGGTLQLDAGVFDNNVGEISSVTADGMLVINGATVVGGFVGSRQGTVRLNGGSVSGAVLQVQDRGEVTANTTVEGILSTGMIRQFNNVVGLRLTADFNNAGIYSMESVGNNTDLIVQNNLAFTDGGEIRFSSVSNSANRIYGGAATTRLTTNNWMHGAGQLGINSLELTNTGTVEADVPAVPLSIDVSGADSVNTGTFRASNAGILHIYPGTFQMQGSGVVEANSDGIVNLDGPTLVEAVLTSDTNGIIRIVSGGTRLQNCQSTAHIVVPNNVVGLRLIGSLHNSSLIELLSIGNNTDLICETDVTLSGGGSVDMADVSNITNRIYGAAASTRLTNQDNFIHGAGQIGANQMLLTNAGHIRADRSGRALLVDPSGQSYNTSLMDAVDGGVLQLASSPYDNTSGQIIAETGSTVQLDGGAVVSGGLVQAHSGGTLTFNGGRTTGSAPIIDVGAFGRITAGGGGCDAGLVNHGLLRQLNNVAPFDLAGLVENTGTFSLESIGNNTDVRLTTDTTFTGAGEVVFADISSSTNRIYGATAAMRLVNDDNWMHGSGQIGVNQMSLSNNGVIECDLPGRFLYIDTTGDAAINTGVFRASSGGTLHIYPDTFNQTGGGRIEAMAGSVVELDGSRFVGGISATEADGVVRVVSASTRLQDVTNLGRIDVPNNVQGLRLVNSFTNDGEVNLLSVGNNTDLICEGDVLIDGSGQITLHDVSNNANRMYAAAGDQTITNASTIRGSGQLGINQTQIVNLGQIVADSTRVLTIDCSGTGLDNQGLLHAVATGGCTIEPAPFTTSGTIQVDPGSFILRNGGGFSQTAGMIDVNGLFRCATGNLELSGGELRVTGELECTTGTVQMTGGTLSGSGFVDCPVLNSAGRCEPGSFGNRTLVDDLTINGSYTQGTDATLAVTLFPNDVATGLFIAGSASLAGTLDVSLPNGFVPDIGTEITVLTTSGVISGGFEQVTYPSGTGVGFEIVQAANRIKVRAVASADCLADWNGDGLLDFFDVQGFLNAYSAHQSAADLNHDGLFDFFDVQAFLGAFSAGCP